jgi:hypothetical protein
MLTEAVCAIWRILTKKHEDYEQQHSPLPSMRSPVPCLTISPNSSALRNFSLPRERCLDTSPVITARPLPVPPPYLAIGIASVVRPLPAIPNKAIDDQSSLASDQMDREFIIQPLRICKTNSCSIKLGQEPLLVVSNAERLSIHPTPDAMSSVESFSSVESLSTMEGNECWPIANNCSTHEASQDDGPKTSGSNDEFTATTIIEEAPDYLPMACLAVHLITPTIEIQKPTPTPSPAPESPKVFTK